VGAVEEDAHAQRLGALGGNEAALAANVIAVMQMLDPGFIPFRIAFEASEALLEGTAEARADFEAFVAAESGIVGHEFHLGISWPVPGKLCRIFS